MSKKLKSSRNKSKDVETKPVPQITPPPRQQANYHQMFQFLDGVLSEAAVKRNVHVQAQKALQQIHSEISRLTKEVEQLKKPK